MKLIKEAKLNNSLRYIKIISDFVSIITICAEINLKMLKLIQNKKINDY